MNGKQLKIVFPERLYGILAMKSEQSGVTMAALVRLAVSEVYGTPETTEEHLGPIEPNCGKIPHYSEEEKVVELEFLAEYQEADEND